MYLKSKPLAFVFTDQGLKMMPGQMLRTQFKDSTLTEVLGEDFSCSSCEEPRNISPSTQRSLYRIQKAIIGPKSSLPSFNLLLHLPQGSYCLAAFSSF